MFHVEQSNIMKKIDSCPVCNSDQQKKFIACRDHLVSGKEFNIAACQSCGFKFTNPRPEDSTLGDYYKSEDYISHTDTKKGLVASIYFRVRKMALKNKEALLRRYVSRGTLLDYGCGTGYFLNYAREKGWKVFGVEPDEGARGIANNKFTAVYPDKLTLNEKEPKIQFEAITLWHVLEHLTDLNESLAHFYSRLKQDGILVIAVPNYLSNDARHYAENWAAYDVPRHLYHFDKNTIQKLLGSHGFELIKTKPMYFDSYYVSMLSEKNKSGKVNFIPALFNGFTSNLKGLFTRNYSSHIYIFKKAS